MKNFFVGILFMCVLSFGFSVHATESDWLTCHVSYLNGERINYQCLEFQKTWSTHIEYAPGKVVIYYDPRYGNDAGMSPIVCYKKHYREGRHCPKTGWRNPLDQ